ncbi:thioredoxin family protein [Ferroglobus sp.]|uniref:thioredoxin family protein n=1 Tax=Ferroglobus sp. TaxID=2614230 RepID=UPI0025C37688|nr:thioredoxin family protein [Ferroglobus sp.]
MRSIAALILIAVGAFFVLFSFQSSPSVEFYSYEEGLKIAAEKNKPILLIVSSNTCVYCTIFKEDFEKYDDLRLALSKFVIVEVDYVRERELAKKFGATGTPEFHFLYPNGTPIMYEGKRVVMLGYSSEYRQDLINLANFAYQIYERSKAQKT